MITISVNHSLGCPALNRFLYIYSIRECNCGNSSNCFNCYIGYIGYPYTPTNCFC